jgi:Protein of unknown function (DUF3761)
LIDLLMRGRVWRLLPFRRDRLVVFGVAAVLLVPLVSCGSTDTSTGPTAIATGTGGVGGAASTPSPTVTPTLTPTPTPTPTPRPTVKPTQKPVQAATTHPTAATVHPTQVPPKPVNTCGAPANPWGYNFCGGATISSPPSSFCGYFNCIKSFWTEDIPGDGYVVRCQDGTYSLSGGESGACSSHGGVSRPLYR